ncbi:unnamed protein product [Linum trigynum]|uniref:Uncharacterized protein n=1 Tax=Linum trigynum TaxID=586398 RepID=A0AAV2F708_9ROSI
MAFKTPILAFLILLIVSCSQVLAGRPVKEDVKQPNFFLAESPTVRGIETLFCCLHRSAFLLSSHTLPPAGRNYIPGADDTFVPNPGFEVSYPHPHSQRGAASARP